MKKFLIEVAIFLVLVLGSFFIVFIQADGSSDPFYIRFTTRKQHALILGTSRAAQGIQPAVLDKILPGNNFFNFSFTLISSPYGPVYLNSIKKKLDQETTNGIFILSVDPWSISSKSGYPNDSTRFKERRQILSLSPWVNLYPNIPYLVNFYGEPFYTLIWKEKTSMFLHNDGWLEVTIRMDSSAIRKNIDRKIYIYKKNNLPNFKYSEVRYEYLIKTIAFLKQHGDVYMVRLPVHPKMMEIDNQLVPDFSEKMNLISKTTGTPYLDLTGLNDSLTYTDGNHLYKESGKIITRRIGNWIAEFK